MLNKWSKLFKKLFKREGIITASEIQARIELHNLIIEQEQERIELQRDFELSEKVLRITCPRYGEFMRKKESEEEE